MATSEEVVLNAAHPPKENSFEAFGHVVHDIKHHILHNRREWDKHEPRMWGRASNLTDHQLIEFTLEKDLVLVRSAPVSYGTIILGKIRIPAINDDEGEGFVHVRIHDPPNKGNGDVKFHSIWHYAGPDPDSPEIWRAIQTKDEELVFFNE